MKTCPYCRKNIDTAAVKCPYCASAFDDQQMKHGMQELSRKRRGNLGLFVLAVIVLIWWLSQPGNVEWLGEKTAQVEQPTSQP